MEAQQVTISLPTDLAHYVDSVPDPSQLVAEALRLYRKHVKRQTLARAYQDAAEESLALHQEWSQADAELPG